MLQNFSFLTCIHHRPMGTFSFWLIYTSHKSFEKKYAKGDLNGKYPNDMPLFVSLIAMDVFGIYDMGQVPWASQLITLGHRITTLYLWAIWSSNRPFYHSYILISYACYKEDIQNIEDLLNCWSKCKARSILSRVAKSFL